MIRKYKIVRGFNYDGCEKGQFNLEKEDRTH